MTGGILMDCKFDMENIDRWSLRQPVFAIKLENIERENFDRSLAKCQIRQYFPPSKFPAIRYSTLVKVVKLNLICTVKLEPKLLLTNNYYLCLNWLNWWSLRTTAISDYTELPPHLFRGSSQPCSLLVE